MSKLAVYTLVSHTGKLLSLQVAAIKRHTPNLHSITAVHGPCMSSNRLVVPQDTAAALDINTMAVPQSFAAIGRIHRVPTIAHWILQQSQSMGNEYTLVLHGDVLPVREVDAKTLLQGQPLAARVSAVTKTIEGWTWLAARTATADWQFRVGDALSRPLDNIRGWLSEPILSIDDLQWITIKKVSDYEQRHHFEWCSPAFLHADKLTTAPQASIDEKVAILFNFMESIQKRTAANATYHRAIVVLNDRAAR